MNIAVLNFSPNVGKTTVAKNLLLPRLPLSYVAIESIHDNADVHKRDTIITANDYPALAHRLLAEENLLVDIGSSQIEKLLHYLKMYVGSHEDFAYFILPMTSDIKSQLETQKTLQALQELGVQSDNIRLIFNKSEASDTTALWSEFREAIHIADNFGIVRPTVGMVNNPIYTELRAHHLTIGQVLEDNEQSHPTLQAFQQATQAAKQNLDVVFDDLALTKA